MIYRVFSAIGILGLILDAVLAFCIKQSAVTIIIELFVVGLCYLCYHLSTRCPNCSHFSLPTTPWAKSCTCQKCGYKVF